MPPEVDIVLPLSEDALSLGTALAKRRKRRYQKLEIEPAETLTYSTERKHKRFTIA
jgi:hypothetical protein